MVRAMKKFEVPPRIVAAFDEIAQRVSSSGWKLAEHDGQLVTREAESDYWTGTFYRLVGTLKVIMARRSVSEQSNLETFVDMTTADLVRFAEAASAETTTASADQIVPPDEAAPPFDAYDLAVAESLKRDEDLISNPGALFRHFTIKCDD
jgi:hypothetical protein